MKKYDVVIIGGGAGGLTVASGASSLGAKVALIEKERHLGGDCLHVGCVPSKALIQASKDIFTARTKAKELGLDVSGSVDLGKVNERVQQSIRVIQMHDSDERFTSLGVDLYKGTGTFTSANTVRVDDQEIYGKRIVIAAGSRPLVPPIEGLQEAGFWTNENLFEQRELPEKLLVIGGGPIGLELSQALSRLGSKVTIVEKGKKLLSTEDESIQKAAVSVLEKELTIQLNSEVKKVEITSNRRKRVTIQKGNEQYTEEYDQILLAVGRKPNSERMNLNVAGVFQDERGFIPTNEKLQTNVPHIFAIGDINGKFAFTHVAGEEGKVVVQNAILGVPKKMSYDHIPWNIYTQPEIFHMGMTEQETRKLGIKFSVYEVPLTDVDRFISDQEADGLIKIITDQKGKILGGHAIGNGSGDWMQSVIFAMKKGSKIGDLSQMIYPYPNHAAAIQRTADLYWRSKLFSGTLPKLTKKYISWFR